MEENTKKPYMVAGVVLVVLAIVIAFLIQKNSATEPGENKEADNTQSTMLPNTGVGTFSGTISAVDTGCFADAVCSVTIDGKKIILVKGGRGLPPDTVVGKLIGVNSIGGLENMMGAFANVYAGLTPEGDYTLYGNSNYYVEVVMISGK
jgi:hypothetical protein